MMYFWRVGHKNYKLEAFHLQSMVNVTASPKIAAQLTWGRVVNIRGGQGHNMLLDLAMEHLNRTLKDFVSSLGANVTEKTILQCGRSLGGIMSVCQTFDKSNDIVPDSVEYTVQSCSQDKTLILNQLVNTSHVFDYVPGRRHQTFPKVQASVASTLDKKMIDWIEKQKVKLQKSIILAKAYGHNL